MNARITEDGLAKSRRTFLGDALTLLWLVSGGSIYGATQLALCAEPETVFKGDEVFNRIKDKAVAENWMVLPIGELMGRIAKELEGTPYVGGTLELSDTKEICSVNLEELDCVTFFETTLGFARMLKKGGRTPMDLLSEIRYTRYRHGRIGDYTSRLHYTGDWLIDNAKKGVIEILRGLPGSKPMKFKVNFMSLHPDSYRQLLAQPKLVSKIKLCEHEINKHVMPFVPLPHVEGIESLIKTGDVIGLCTSIAGLDISHTGLIYRTEDGVAHFMDASSKKANMKVTIEPGPISKAIQSAKNVTGVIVARPLEPAN